MSKYAGKMLVAIVVFAVLMTVAAAAADMPKPSSAAHQKSFAEATSPLRGLGSAKLTPSLKKQTEMRQFGEANVDVSMTLKDLAQIAADENKIYSRLQDNLSQKRANEAEFKQIDADYEAYQNDFNQAAGYCSGEFPEPEYSRRKAQCESMQQQFDQRFANIQDHLNTVNTREAARVEAAQQLLQEFNSLERRAAIIRNVLKQIAGMRECAQIEDLEEMHRQCSVVWDGHR